MIFLLLLMSVSSKVVCQCNEDSIDWYIKMVSSTLLILGISYLSLVYVNRNIFMEPRVLLLLGILFSIIVIVPTMLLLFLLC